MVYQKNLPLSFASCLVHLRYSSQMINVDLLSRIKVNKTKQHQKLLSSNNDTKIDKIKVLIFFSSMASVSAGTD